MNQVKYNSLKNKKILIFQQRNWGRNIGHFLAGKLQAEGCRLAALTFKNTTHQFIIDQQDVKYDLIINNDEIMGRPLNYLKDESFSLADICADLGVDSIWPLVMTLRHHVRSYADKYYYSFRQNVADEQIVDFVMAAYKYMKRFFNDFKPDLILAPNFVALPHLMFNLYAKKQGVTMLTVTDSKVSRYRIFSYNHNDDQGPFFDRVDALNQGLTDSANRVRARHYIAEFRQQFKKPQYLVNYEQQIKKDTLIKKIRHELAPFYHSLRWFTNRPQNYVPSTGITIDYRPPKIIFRDHYAGKSFKKFMDKYQYWPFDRLDKFVYFPLQYQPEEVIDVIAPYFSNQLETARQIAMSLPDDYTLAVKEHPAMVGLRPPSYIEKIARTPNIKLIDYKIATPEILKKTSLVISPNSTALAEAAFFHKPAIQLGNLGTTLKLPNVFKHTDLTSLSTKIKEILAIKLGGADYERRLENFVAAVLDTGFDFNYKEVWERGRLEEDMEILWQIYKKEITNIFNQG